MRNRLPLLSGLALATLGVSGLAGGGLLWNFQGRTLGLGSTVTALVLLGISFVLLRPEPRLSPVAAVLIWLTYVMLDVGHMQSGFTLPQSSY